jgi:hypothetical protein
MNNYLPFLSASINRKGVLDIDTVKGCRFGMEKYPNGGCYGLCYAAKTAKFYGYDFSKSVSRKLSTPSKQLNLFNKPVIYGKKNIKNIVKNHGLKWFRIGTMGDPCHDWDLTATVCEWLCRYKKPVVITKHWDTLSDSILDRLSVCCVVINTSISALDTGDEIEHRLAQFNRMKRHGIRSVLRIVSCKFGKTDIGTRLDKIQIELFKNSLIIDNPLRIPLSDDRVVKGDIIAEKIKDITAIRSISLNNESAYLGNCRDCPDSCGVL